MTNWKEILKYYFSKGTNSEKDWIVNSKNQQGESFRPNLKLPSYFTTVRSVVNPDLISKYLFGDGRWNVLAENLNYYLLNKRSLLTKDLILSQNK